MTVAVKTIKRYKSEQETSDFLREMGVMMDLMHPNIIHLYGIVEQGLSEAAIAHSSVATFVDCSPVSCMKSLLLALWNNVVEQCTVFVVQFRAICGIHHEDSCSVCHASIIICFLQNHHGLCCSIFPMVT